MNPEEFLKTIYLGDRACHAIHLEGWKNEIKIKIDCISRVRGQTWDFYTKEDIQDGFLVFEKVQEFRFEPPGLLPNDWIEIVSVERLNTNNNLWKIVFSLGAVDSEGRAQEVLLNLLAGSISLESFQGSRIRN